MPFIPMTMVHAPPWSFSWTLRTRRRCISNLSVHCLRSNNRSHGAYISQHMVQSLPLVVTCAWHVIRAQYLSIPRCFPIRCEDSSQRSGSRARGSQDMDTVNHSLLLLLTHSPQQVCLEPTSHLGRILAIGVAEFPGEIRLFTGNDPIAQHQDCGHNQEQYPQGIDQQRYANVQQCQCDIDRIATVAERSLSNQRCG